MSAEEQEQIQTHKYGCMYRNVVRASAGSADSCMVFWQTE